MRMRVSSWIGRASLVEKELELGVPADDEGVSTDIGRVMRSGDFLVTLNGKE